MCILSNHTNRFDCFIFCFFTLFVLRLKYKSLQLASQYLNNRLRHVFLQLVFHELIIEALSVIFSHSPISMERWQCPIHNGTLETFFWSTMHCDLKVSYFQAKIDENFSNHFLKTKANNKCLKLLKCTC